MYSAWDEERILRKQHFMRLSSHYLGSVPGFTTDSALGRLKPGRKKNRRPPTEISASPQ
jgi:hypothetical protein